jgi:phosphatidylserine decarboxylase
MQIASRLVRRIVAYVREGDGLNLDQRIAMFRFGPQVDVLLPKLEDLTIKVRIGEQVYGGLSIIAEI